MRLFFFNVIILLLLAGCSEERDVVENNAANHYISFNITKQPEIRAAVSEDGSGIFQEGDRIGLYCFGQGYEGTTKHFVLTYTNGQWLPRLTQEQILVKGSIFTTVSAYYPYDETVEDIPDNPSFHEFVVNTDQYTPANIQKADLLWASKPYVTSSVSEIDLNFKHALLRVNVDVSSIKTKNLDVEIYSGVKGIIRIEDGKTFLANTSSGAWVKPHHINEECFSAVVFPPFNDYDNKIEKKLQVKLTAPGKDPVFYNMNVTDLLKYGKPGSSFLLRLGSSGDGVVDEEFANRKVWFHGIDTIQTPLFPDKPWHVIFEDAAALLPYDEMYGWFDCNKKFYIDNETMDEYQCWAAAASNLIHWWLKNNEPYSSRYVEWYNKKLQSGQDRFMDYKFEPLTYTQSGGVTTVYGGSRIFDYFTSHFDDAGGYTHEGVEWFFFGEIPSAPTMKGESVGGGFFKDVPLSGIVELKSGMSKKVFNEAVKDAIRNKQVFSYSIRGHVQNVWGAEFDEFGNVNYVYGVDNNQSFSDADAYGGAVCARYSVRYEDNGSTTLIGGHTISRLAVMSLKKEEFETYVNNNCK